MAKNVALAALLVLACLPVAAQQGPLQDPLLDRLAGTWVLRGTIGGSQTTHDVDAEWVLAHGYVRLHEVSREKGSDGQPAYEAIVLIGWDADLDSYACLWLDSTGSGGLKGWAIAHAKRDGDRIPFLFRGSDGSPFHTTFVYDRRADSWQWLMDGEQGGKLEPFARVTLTRK
jgi:hypothetical protein